MKESTKFSYFILGITFCLLILAIAGLILYDQIDMKVIIVISRNNLTLPNVEVVPL